MSLYGPLCLKTLSYPAKIPFWGNGASFKERVHGLLTGPEYFYSSTVYVFKPTSDREWVCAEATYEVGFFTFKNKMCKEWKRTLKLVVEAAIGVSK